MKLIMYSLLLSSLASAVQAYDLTVNLSGAPDKKGTMMVGLFNSPKGFPEGKEPLRSQKIKADADVLTVLFKKLPKGQYAVAVIHDQNNNDILDRSFAGIPTEPYGFSNNARGKMGPPTFEQAAFEIVNENKMIAIELVK